MKFELQVSEAANQRVELHGEFPHWESPIALTEVATGRFSVNLDLAPGVYACKLRLPGSEWRLLPNCPSDDAISPTNSTLVVGGSRPPVIFAPCRRCWVRRPDGDLRVHFEVEHGAHEPDVVLLDEHRLVCARAAAHWRRHYGSRVLLRVRTRLPESARYLQFEGYTDEWALPEVESTKQPAWLRQGVVYSIFVDRWFRGSTSPPDERASRRDATSTRTTLYGGDIDGVRQSLGYLRELGVTALALTPIHPSPSPHRYDAIDFASVDSRLGGETALDDLIRDSHASEIAVILDLAFSHCHATHAAFQDLLKHQKDSPYVDWFQPNRFPVTREEPDSYRHYAGLPHLPLLNLDCPTLREHLLSSVLSLVSRGVDGFRLDAIEMVPDSFWVELRRRVRAANEDVALLGECLVEPILRYIGTADAVTDFCSRELMLHGFGTTRIDAGEMIRALDVITHRHGPDTEAHRLLFLDNHDTNRFLTEAALYPRLRLALTFLLLRSEPVWFYYGTEHAMSSHVCRVGQDNAWPDRLPMVELDIKTSTGTLVRQLMGLRRTLVDGGYGPAQMLDHGKQLVCFERTSTRRRIRVLLNPSSVTVPLPDWCRTEETLLCIEHAGSFENGMPPQTGLVTCNAVVADE